jgi:hypothetical protein
MPETDAPIEDVPDICELLDTGRVRLVFNGKTITLRPIKMGELKKLKRAYFELPQQRKETVEQLTDADVDRWVGWLKIAVDTLGDGKLPSGKGLEALPGAWCTMNFAALLINHWQSVPLPRGVATP